MILNFKLIRITACRCHHFGNSMSPAHHCAICCRSTFGPHGTGLSNPTSFMRPALPMTPKTDNKARDERSVLRPNQATSLRDLTLYMTTNHAIIRKMCLNYNACITHLCSASPKVGQQILAKIAKQNSGTRG